MSRYIDADKLAEYEEHAWDWDTVNGIETATALRQVISDIRHEPTADVVDRNECLKCAFRPFKQLREQIETNMVEAVHEEWIPYSERLPEENGRYLVTRGLNACGSLWNRVYIVNYSDLMGLKKEKIWWDGNVGKSDFQTYEDVLAWQPLPAPWNGAKMDKRREDER